jgi:hypothetical protein
MYACIMRTRKHDRQQRHMCVRVVICVHAATMDLRQAVPLYAFHSPLAARSHTVGPRSYWYTMQPGG